MVAVQPTTRDHVQVPGHAPGARAASTVPLWYSAMIAVLLMAVTGYGLLDADAYRVSPGVREDFPDVMRGQDVVTLLTVPLLAWSAYRARTGSLRMHLLWLGLVLYYAYTYVIYAFSPYNDVFLAYVILIGMTGYALLDGLFRLDLRAVAPAAVAVPRRGLAVFLAVVGCFFTALWLAMILPAIPGDLPAGRVTYDIASAVHVLDLAFIMPLLFATAWLTYRGRVIGVVLAAVLLAKMVTLGLALLAMNLGFTDSPNAGEIALWVVVAAVAAAVLTRVLRAMQTPAAPWMRSRLWPE